MKALMAEAKRCVDCMACLPANRLWLPVRDSPSPSAKDLPDKIYKDCHAGPRFHNCDQVAMVRGSLPKFAIFPEAANWLVKLQSWAREAENQTNPR